VHEALTRQFDYPFERTRAMLGRERRVTHPIHTLIVAQYPFAFNDPKVCHTIIQAYILSFIANLQMQYYIVV